MGGYGFDDADGRAEDGGAGLGGEDAGELEAGGVGFQDEPLEVTLQVLDDVSTIEGVLMPLEEEPERGANADSAAPAENPPPEAAKGEDR